MSSCVRSFEFRRSVRRSLLAGSILFFGTMATAQAQTNTAEVTKTMSTAPRATRSSPGVLNSAAAATDAAVEREGQRQRDVRSLLIRPLYRDPTKVELASLAVEPGLRERFIAFLSLPDTGITRLLTDVGCGNSTRTISASSECIARTAPGSGSAFSFR